MHMISFGGQLQNVKQFECTQVVSCQIDDCHPVGWFRKTWACHPFHWERFNASWNIAERGEEEGGVSLRNRIRGGSGGDYEDDHDDRDYGDHDICRSC